MKFLKLLMTLNFKKHLLKLFSVFFAFFVWLYVISSSEIQLEKNIKVNYILPENMALVNNVTRKVKFTIKGPQAFVRTLLERNGILNVDLNDHFLDGEYEYSFPVQSLGIIFPLGVDIVSIEPERLEVQIDYNKEKIVPIQFRQQGSVSADHKIVSTTIIPETITVSGPEVLINQVEFVETAPIDVSSLKGEGSLKVSLINKDMRVKFPMNQVRFDYNIRPTRANLLIRDVPIHFYSSRIVKQLSRRKVNLMVLAKTTENVQLSKKDVRVIAEVPDDSKGNIQINLKATLPEDFQLLEIIPDTIEVNIDN